MRAKNVSFDPVTGRVEGTMAGTELAPLRAMLERFGCLGGVARWRALPRLPAVSHEGARKLPAGRDRRPSDLLAS